MTKRRVFVALAIGIAACAGCGGGSAESDAELVGTASQASEKTLGGTAQQVSATATLIKARVLNNPQLTGLSIGIHVATKPFRGIYSPTSKSAAMLLAQTEFDTLKSDLANGALISISLSYDDADNSVTMFCFSGKCVP